MVARQKLRSTKLVASCIQKPPAYVPIRCNEYVRGPRPALRRSEVPVCNCEPAAGGQPCCGADCLNRLLYTECTPGFCKCGKACQNQRIQMGKMAHTRLQHMGQKGWGLVATAHIPAGELVIEYVGEVVDDEESARRVVQYEADGLVHTYIMTLSSTEVIDATRKGNLSRFINHSCDANCETQKWVVSGDVRVCVVARRKIRVGEEITYNYNLEWNGQKRVRCVCGAANCHKYLGGQSKRFRRLLEQGPVLNQEVLQFNDEDEEMVAVDVLDMFSSDDEEAPTLAPSSSLAICSGVEERGQHGQHAPRASQPPKRQRRDADDQSVAPEADRLSTTLQPAPKAWDDGSQQRPQLCTAVAPSQQSRLHPAAGNASLFEGDEQSTALQAKPHLLSTTQASLQSCASALMQQSASSPHRSLSAVTPPGFQAPRVACSPISAVSLLAAEAASQQAASSLQRCPSQCPSELLPQASRQHGAPYAQPRPQGVSEPQAGPSLEPLLPQVHVLQHYSSLQSTASQRPAEAPHAVQLPGSPTDAESYISPSKLSRLPTRAAKMWRARQLQPSALETHVSWDASADSLGACSGASSLQSTMAAPVGGPCSAGVAWCMQQATLQRMHSSSATPPLQNFSQQSHSTELLERPTQQQRWQRFPAELATAHASVLQLRHAPVPAPVDLVLRKYDKLINSYVSQSSWSMHIPRNSSWERGHAYM